MKRFFLDFDGTSVNSRKAYCDAYELLYSDCENYEHPNWKETGWNISEICPLCKDNLFDHDLFFYELTFMEGAYNIIKELNKTFDITICSIGSYDNIAKKSKWIKSKMPFIKESIFINNGHNHADKSVIDMSGGIFVDDVSSNLKTSNADVKICFGEVCPWNKDWNGIRCVTWGELYKELMKYV